MLCGFTVCEQLADGIRIAASAAAIDTTTTTIATIAITSIVTVTTFVPLCFMLTILSFIPYSFYRHATWAVEMESFHSFIHENIKSQKLVFIIFFLFPQATTIMCTARDQLWQRGVQRKKEQLSHAIIVPPK